MKISLGLKIIPWVTGKLFFNFGKLHMHSIVHQLSEDDFENGIKQTFM